MRPSTVAPWLMLALAAVWGCEPRSASTEPARHPEAGRLAEKRPGSFAIRPATAEETPAEEHLDHGNVRSGLDEAEPAPAASREPAAQLGAPATSSSAGKLAACCRGLREMAAQAPAPQQDLVLRVAADCERLSTNPDITAAKRELRGQLVSIDPPASCH